jgi:hypothetical protein
MVATSGPWPERSGRSGSRPTAIRGTYHHFDVHQYVGRYLAEAQYRVNHRFELQSLVGRLLTTCAGTAPNPEVWLRLGEIRGS